jgi:hypothetical protein
VFTPEIELHRIGRCSAHSRAGAVAALEGHSA